MKRSLNIKASLIIIAVIELSLLCIVEIDTSTYRPTCKRNNYTFLNVNKVHANLAILEMCVHFTHLVTHPPTNSLTHPLPQPLTHPPTHSLTHPLSHPPTHSLTHSLTQVVKKNHCAHCNSVLASSGQK